MSPTTARRYVLTGKVALHASVYSTAVVPSLNRIYVVTTLIAHGGEKDSIEALDLKTRRVVQRIALPSGGSKPATVTALAVDPATRRVYVVTSGFNQGGGPSGPNTLTVYNAASRKVATIGVGVLPGDIALDPAGQRAYVANSGAGTVSVVNTRTNRRIRTIKLPHAPTLGQLLVDHATHRLVVAFDSSSGAPERVAIVNTTNARILRVLIIGGNGNPYGTNETLALDPVLHQIWIGAFNVAAIRVLNLSNLAVTIPLQATRRGTLGLAVDPGSRTLFVTLPDDSANTTMYLSAVDLRTRNPVSAATETFEGGLDGNPFNHGAIVYGEPNFRTQSGFLYFYSPRR